MQVAEKLKALKLTKSTQKVEDVIEETLIYMNFPTQHGTQIWTNNTIELLNNEIKCCTKVIGAFPDRQSTLMLVYAKLYHTATTSLEARRHMNMDHLFKLENNLLADVIADRLQDTKR